MSAALLQDGVTEVEESLQLNLAVDPVYARTGDHETATLFIKDYDNPPIANIDQFEMDEDEQLVIVAANLVSNDSDPDEGDRIRVTAVSELSAEGGLVTLDGLVITYTPTPNFDGIDSFSYTVSDLSGHEATGIVELWVRNLPDYPTIIAPDELSTNKDTQLKLAGTGRISVDDWEDSQNPGAFMALRVSVLNGGVLMYFENGFLIDKVRQRDLVGTMTLLNEGLESTYFVPDAGFVGQATLQLKVTDSDGLTGEETVVVNVESVEPPSITVALDNDIVDISWQYSGVEFLLESTYDLASGEWTTVSNSEQSESNGVITVRIAIEDGKARFFRLLRKETTFPDPN
jgi:hypothetical protein